jgi:hypothetical protein
LLSRCAVLGCPGGGFSWDIRRENC